MHAGGGGDVELESRSPPCPAEHAGQHVLARSVEGVASPPATQVVFAEPGDTQHQAHDVGSVGCVGSHVIDIPKALGEDVPLLLHHAW